MTTSRQVVLALLLSMIAGGSTACSNTKSQPRNQADSGPPAIIDASTMLEPTHDASVAACPEPGTSAPADVFCIGLYEGRDPTRYAASALPYTPGVILWSDGAEKHRYLSLPPSTQIDNSDMDEWKFPVGTKAFKEFRFDGKLVETRLAWKQAEGNWVFATYIWDSERANASLNESRTPVVLADDYEIPTARGYEIPTARDCGKCHHGGADKLLGVEAIALALPSAKGVTLAKLAAAHQLSNPPAKTSITLPEDASGKAADALGYLHANCGMPCHSSRGLGHATELLLRLRADEFWPAAPDEDAGASAGDDSTFTDLTQTDTYRVTVNQKPTTASVAAKFPDALRITPGSHEKSLLWLLAHRRGEYQMPPLVSHKVDDVGTQKLADWIDAL
jgi:hypothetical protein